MAEPMRLPRGNNPNLPKPPPLPEYDDEVLRVARKQLEATRTITKLQDDLHSWRRKALGHEEEIHRLESRLEREAQDHGAELAKLTEGHERAVDKLTGQRDYWRGQYSRVETHLPISAKIILDALHEGQKREQENASLKAVAEALAPDAHAPDGAASMTGGADEAPLPAFLAQGPRADEGKQL